MSNQFQPILSICIPTFNRCGLLRIGLETVIKQLTPAISSQVEIIVADNASADATQHEVQNIQSLHPDIVLRYFRQTRNTGSDGNIQTLLKLAVGTFVYLLSDDDLLLEGAIQKLLDLIAAHPDIDAFCLNMRPFLQDVSEPTTCLLVVPDEIVLSNQNEALERISTLITFLSIFAFRREIAAEKDYSALTGCFIVQSYFFVDVLAHRGKLLITAQPYLGIRDNNAAGYNFFQAFVTNYAALLNYAQQQGFAEDTVRRLMRAHLRIYILDMVYCRFKQPKGFGSIKPNYLDGIQRLVSVYGTDSFLWFILIPIILTPRPLIRPAHSVYLQLKRFVKPAKPLA